MTVPQWALLGFSVWTLLVLFGTVGVYRWARILTGRARIFPNGRPTSPKAVTGTSGP